MTRDDFRGLIEIYLDNPGCATSWSGMLRPNSAGARRSATACLSIEAGFRPPRGRARPTGVG